MSWNILSIDTNLTTIDTSLLCGDNCVSLKRLASSDLSSIDNFDNFRTTVFSELIDAKHRKTISRYATLRLLYDRYYFDSQKYSNNASSSFDYTKMDQFAGLIDNYWVDIVEQVIPATTIWGSVKIYSNTLFDQQKFHYKSYSSLFCQNPFSGDTVASPINGTSGLCQSVEVIMTPLNVQSNPNVRLKNPTTKCDSICIAQMNVGSEFIGTVQVVKIQIGVPHGGHWGSTGLGNGHGSYTVIEDLPYTKSIIE